MGSLGMPEILMILVIALIIFGPRKLPELGKTLGKSLAQFRRASEDFKRQWEDEVELERRRIEPPSPPPVERSSESAVLGSSPAEANDAVGTTPDESQPVPAVVEATAAGTTPEESQPVPAVVEATASAQHEAAAAQETKRDWM